MRHAGIIGVGKALPDRVLTNFDLEKIVDTSDEWIRTRTGINARRIIDDDRNVSDLAAEAGAEAISSAGLSLTDIDFVLVASGSPEMIWPSTACLAAGKMGLTGVPALDIQAACTGFSYGLAVAASMVESGSCKKILLIGAEAMSRYLDWQDRNTCVLFGDAAAAVVVAEVDEYGIMYNYLGSDGGGADILKITPQGSVPVGQVEACVSPSRVSMRGREVYKFAVRVVEEALSKVFHETGLGPEDIDHLLLHQANQRITDHIVDRLSFDPEKVPSNIADYGNTSTASIPLLVERLAGQGKLARGDRVLMVGFGAGLTWGANLLAWNYDTSSGSTERADG